MKITREVLILREILSLLESLKPMQRERCIQEILRQYPRALAEEGRQARLIPVHPQDKEADHET